MLMIQQFHSQTYFQHKCTCEPKDIWERFLTALFVIATDWEQSKWLSTVGRQIVVFIHKMINYIVMKIKIGAIHNMDKSHNIGFIGKIQQVSTRGIILLMFKVQIQAKWISDARNQNTGFLWGHMREKGMGASVLGLLRC